MKPPRSILRKTEILRGYRAFSRVIAAGRHSQKGVVRCFFLINSHEVSRFAVGFSVSRNISHAADRNRARRWMKEAYRINRTSVWGTRPPGAGERHVVFLFRPQTSSWTRTNTYQEVAASIIAHLKDLQREFSNRS